MANNIHAQSHYTAQRRPSTGSELVSLGVFTVIIAVVSTVCNMIGVLGPQIQPVGAVLAAILNGIPFILFLRRVQHFGLVTAMATLLGLISAMLGHGLVGVPIAALVGLLTDAILRGGGYADPRRGVLGYGVFGLYPLGNLLPLLFMRDAMVERYAGTPNEEWVRAFSEFFSAPMILALGVLLFLGGLAGGWLGQRMARTYFSRAGL